MSGEERECPLIQTFFWVSLVKVVVLIVAHLVDPPVIGQIVSKL